MSQRPASNRHALNRRVVVTGMGIVSPIGNDLASSWDSIVNGRSGIGPITHFDASTFTTRIAGEVRDFDVTRWVSPKDAKKMEEFIHYGVAASLMALQDAGLEINESNAERVGALIGSGIGGLLGIEEQTIKAHEGGSRKISPFYVPSTIINMLPGQVSLLTGAKGPNFSAVSACATSNHSIGMAMRMIQYGDADVMVAGGAERGSSPSTKPSRSLSHGREACVGSSLRVDIAFIEQKPPIDVGVDPRSAPPAIMMSASPC